MPNKDRILMYLSVALLFLAIVACVPPTTTLIRLHDYQDGLISWKCIVDNKPEQETKYSYNDKGDLVSIEFLSSGSPYFISSYLEYITVKDSAGKEVRYRYCSKRIHYKEATHLKDWEEVTTIIVINTKPKIKSIVTSDGTGALMYRDEYEYDQEGRKITAIRTHEDGKYTRYEYTYDKGKQLGVVSEEYYFETPQVYYNLRQYLNWCTLASLRIPIENVTTPTFVQ